MRTTLLALAAFLLASLSAFAADPDPPSTWKLGSPIITAWAFPPLTDKSLQQMSDAGLNTVWCGEAELDLVHAHGLRAMLQSDLLSPATLDNPAQLEKLDALIDRVRHHTALYCYFLTDEPGAAKFESLGRLVAHLRRRDPAHMAYINLFPTYATNEQLGTQGETAPAYRDYLQRFTRVVKPALISYDHYQFMVGKDLEQYFLNLAMVRTAAQEAGVPFLNIVQAASWQEGVRVPVEGETRYLVYTTLAYGAGGISYYVYYAPGHTGGLASADGTPTAIYPALQKLNREFMAIAAELQPLRSQAIYHTALTEPGCVPLPADAPIRLAPVVPTSAVPRDTRGFLLGCFGTEPGKTTHVLIVNLDYRAAAVTGPVAPGKLELFDATTGKWSPATAPPVLHLPPGGGQLVRIVP
jgi:hypothetical protein